MIFSPTMKQRLFLLALVLAACSADHDATASGDVGLGKKSEIARAIAGNETLASAQSAIDAHHPWRATQLLMPVLKDPSRRNAAALVVAARAAAGWNGWAEVDKLLAKEPWIDQRFDGEARELLAQAALERSADTLALRHARAALADARNDSARALRSVYLARAFERNYYYDSAAVLYARAAKRLKPVHDWLMLRVAGTQRDSAARAKTFAMVKSPVARKRIPWTEAQARERSQDPGGAATRYAALGATVSAARLRLLVAKDSAGRQAVRAQLVDFVRRNSGSAEARQAVDILDKSFKVLTPAEELVVARSAALSGPASRAVAGFENALTSPALITPGDRLAYGLSLTRVDRTRDGLAQLGMIEGPYAGQAAYQRARVLLTTGTGAQTRAALRDEITRFPTDTVATPASLFLLADLYTDDGDDDAAQALYRQLYHGYPASGRAAPARFHAAIISYAKKRPLEAALAFDSLIALFPRSDDAGAARYWAGRAYADAGDSITARLRWHDAIGVNIASYYGALAARRLATQPWLPPARGDDFADFSDIDAAMARVDLLDHLGMDTERGFELDALEDAAAQSPERAAATAHAFLLGGQTPRAMKLAQKLVEGDQRDARAYRLLYPLIDRDELERAAKENNVDPWMVAGIIRQESSFNPRAVSSANACGLMQVLPSVGQEIATNLKFPVWYPALLLDPDANLQLGMAHLKGMVDDYKALPRVLAAYNAGGSRVTRWSQRGGMDDPELFAERIPFVETRDYVRQVQRNATVYRMLYGS